MNSLKNIWNDETFYGHFLTNLPNKLWDFTTTDQLIFYQKPDPGSAKRIYLIFETFTVTQRWPNGNIKHLYAATNILLAKYLEKSVRLIGGGMLAICSIILLAPFVFVVKMVHLIGRQLTHSNAF